MKPRRFYFRILLVGLAAVAGGCQSKGNYPAATVSGRVTLDGAAVPKGYVTFSPAADGQGPVTGAAIDRGKYRCERVPLGKHVVTFIAQGEKPVKIHDAITGGEHEVPQDILPPALRGGVPVEITPGQIERDFALTSK
jgi:hypothetical protein